MDHEQLSARTQDGDCPVHAFTPRGDGPWPAVIFFMDGLAIRPTLFAMAERLAGAGYVVLLPDLFYRAGPYAPLVPAEVFATGDPRAALAHLFGSTDNHRAAQDTQALLDYIDSRSDIAGARIGTTGYCMGGAISLTVAGTYPERIAAAASFHAGNLVTDTPLSPHLLAPRIRAKVYVAGADQDRSYPPTMAEALDKALTDAGVDHRCEIYPGAAHGWTMADFPIYNPAADQRHWDELLKLFKQTLG